MLGGLSEKGLFLFCFVLELLLAGNTWDPGIALTARFDDLPFAREILSRGRADTLPDKILGILQLKLLASSQPHCFIVNLEEVFQ